MPRKRFLRGPPIASSRATCRRCSIGSRGVITRPAIPSCATVRTRRSRSKFSLRSTRTEAWSRRRGPSDEHPPAMKRIAEFSSMLFLAGCATSLVEADIAERAQAVFVAAFADGDAQILARVEHQDEAQGLCSKYHNEPPPGVAQLIERTQRAAMRYPSSGRLMGDWHQGKIIAEDTTGMR